MKLIFALSFIFLSVWNMNAQQSKNPVAKTVNATDTYFGKELIDLPADATLYPDALRKIGNTYFFIKLLPGEQLPKLYRRIGENGEDELLFDPDKFQEGKSFEFSFDVNSTATHLLLNIKEKQKEQGDIYLMDLQTKKILPEIIYNSIGSFSRNHPQSLFYHKAVIEDMHDSESMMDV